MWELLVRLKQLLTWSTRGRHGFDAGHSDSLVTIPIPTVDGGSDVLGQASDGLRSDSS